MDIGIKDLEIISGLLFYAKEKADLDNNKDLKIRCDQAIKSFKDVRRILNFPGDKIIVEEKEIYRKMKVSDNQDVLIREFELYLNNFKEIDKSDIQEMRKLEERVQGDFCMKFYDNFIDAYRLLGRIISEYYPLTVGDEFLKLLKRCDYKTATKEIIVYMKDNNYRF